MKISELKSNRYDVLKVLSKSDREATIKTITYIETLASRTGADISDWDILHIFGKPNDPLCLIGAKNEVNKLFFEAQEKHLNPDAATVSEADLKKIKLHGENVDKNWKIRKIEEHRRSQNSYFQRATQYHAEANNYVQHAFGSLKEIMKLENRSFDSTHQALEILKDKFWKFRDVSGSCLQFETANEVILSEVNPAANVNIQVNLGKFIASLDIANASVKLMPLAAFVPGARIIAIKAAGGYYHPHFDTSGSPCWGSASTQAAQFLATGEFVELMKLLAALITTYSPARPYAALIHFKKAADALDGAVINEPKKEEATQPGGMGQNTTTINLGNLGQFINTSPSNPFATAFQAVQEQARQEW